MPRIGQGIGGSDVKPRPARKTPSKPGPAPKPTPAFAGPQTAGKPFQAQQRQAATKTRQATRKLPRAPVAAPPVIHNPTPAQVHAAAKQITTSINTAIGSGGTNRERIARRDALLNQVKSDPHYAPVKASLTHWAVEQAKLIHPEAFRDTVKAGPPDRKAKLGVGPLNLATVNLTALGRGAGNLFAEATPGLHAGTPEAKYLLHNAGGDVASLAVGAIPALYGAGSAIIGDVAQGPGHYGREMKFGKGVAQSTIETVTHPGEHPILAPLTILGGISAVGRTGGALARAAGEKGAPGLRGKLDEHSHVVRPPVSMTNDAGQPSPVQRTYSKDLTRRAAQVHQDSKREPLRDSNGDIVYRVDRGRKVPILKSTEGEQIKHANQRGDFLASRTNARERTVRQEGGRATKVKGPRGKAARDIVALAIQGAITGPAHFEADLRVYRKMVADSITEHESGARPFRDKGDLEHARDNLKLADRVLNNPKAMAQGPKILAEGTRIGGDLHAGDMANAAAELGDEHALRRSGLIVPAVTHMGGRHFTVEEHQALERQAAKAETAAIERYQKAKTPADRQAALADLNTARENRIAVSGRHPDQVRAHESAQASLSTAKTRAKTAHAAEEASTRKITALVARHRSERGREAHHGPVAAYHVGGQRFVLLRDAAAYAKTHGIKASEIERVATTHGEAARVGEISKARRAHDTIKARRRTADKAVKKAERAVKDNPRPETKAGVRYGENNPYGKPAGSHLPTSDIEDFLRSRGRDPETVAYLPHRHDVRGARAHHTQFRPGARPVLDAGETRTGEAFRRGIAETSTQLIRDQGVRQRIQLVKAQQIDKLVADHGLAHPALAKLKAGGKLTPAEQRIVDKGGLFTAKEALEASKRLEADTGQRYTPMTAHSARLDPETRRVIREDLQGPGAMDSLSSRLLNNRIVTPDKIAELDKGARNIVLVPSTLVERLNAHLAPAGQVEKLFQYINRPFRYAVLPQFRWLTGNFVEPYLIRLPTVGSGLVNIPGMAVDAVAFSKGLKALDAGTPEMRATANEIRAQQTGSGLFIGGGEKSAVRRTPSEFLPERANKAYGRLVSKLPVVDQMAQMTATGVHWLVAPLRGFFEFNQHAIENPAQRVAFGHQFRKDIQALTGSWTKSVTLSAEAVADAAKGLVDTPAQHRFMDAQHELLGKYNGYSPRMRALVQTIAPFLPWMLNSLRFIFWTMPAHNTVKTAVLMQMQQAMANDWQEIHKNTPPGNLRYAIPNGKGGWIDLARYTPWGALTGVVGGGDLGSLTGEFLPQAGGVEEALRGHDPFGRDLQIKPTKSNPQGKATGWDKLEAALNSAAEAVIPYVSTARRLQEHGETSYSNSNVFSPKTKPGTSHGMSAVRRTFDPLRPTYLGGSVSVDVPDESQSAAPEPTPEPRLTPAQQIQQRIRAAATQHHASSGTSAIQDRIRAAHRR